MLLAHREEPKEIQCHVKSAGDNVAYFVELYRHIVTLYFSAMKYISVNIDGETDVLLLCQYLFRRDVFNAGKQYESDSSNW